MAELDVKRIINFTEQSTLSPGDYVAVDSSGNGTKNTTWAVYCSRQRPAHPV